jgi:hypothetical protein
MPRPCIGAVPMNPAERARRHRAKLAMERRLHCAEPVLAALDRDYIGASATDKQILRRGVAKLLRAWEREAVRVGWEPKRRAHRGRWLEQRRKVGGNLSLSLPAGRWNGTPV